MLIGTARDPTGLLLAHLFIIWSVMDQMDLVPYQLAARISTVSRSQTCLNHYINSPPSSCRVGHGGLIEL